MSDERDSPWSTTGDVELPPGVERPSQQKTKRQARDERWSEWMNAQMPGAAVYAVASAGRGSFAWAAWASLADAEAARDPIFHGTAEREEDAAKIARGQLAARPTKPSPRIGRVAAKLLHRWRRKVASAKRAKASTASATDARVTGVVFEHWCETDYNTGPPMPDILAYRNDARGFFRAMREWNQSLPRAWFKRVHRIVKRTPKLVFVLREPGETARGADLDGVTVADCWTFPRDMLEAGRAIWRATQPGHRPARESGGFGDVSSTWWALSEEFPPEAERRERLGDTVYGLGTDGDDAPTAGASGGDVPACLRALGLGWPTTVADVKRAFKQRAHEAHPDHGGTSAAFVELRAHYKRALALVGGA